MRFGQRRSKRAAVLGCGPTGLFAAHALIENGWSVGIYSKARKSHLFGAQYLHMPVPGLTPDGAPVPLKYLLTGTPEGYREKVYGIGSVVTSVEVLGQEHPAWDIRATYDAAWERYGSMVTDMPLSPEALGVTRWDPMWESNEALPLSLRPADFDVILSSIPAPTMCYQTDLHQFQSAQVWAMGDAPSQGQYVPFRPGDGIVECNGDPDTGWYRAANVYGHATVEWPANRKPPLPGVANVTKPIRTDCNCYQDHRFQTKYIPIGRYGRWTKGVLTHDAYNQAANL